jgi:acyl-CoA synthetase (AMP-forming)/AMP-acid ligase II/thioesterase domain-containing protein
MLTLHDLILDRASSTPAAVAIAAPDRSPLTYGRLRAQTEQVVAFLNGLGIGREDRVAVVLPNGPEMAVAFVAVAAGATCAPLSPAYQAAEFELYLSELKAKAVIVQAGMASPVLDVARARGVLVLELSPTLASEAGVFALKGERDVDPVQTGLAAPDDVALVLHTSGTTSRPKIVPLTHANICTSAGNIRAGLGLTPGDCCLNLMPLFHVHGLIGALLSSLGAGGTVVCTSGYSSARFLEWMRTFRPTWYTAVPTIHQAIQAQAAEDRELLAQFPLRFLRSCSSALAPQLMERVERTLKTPIVEAYGMTEAAHQIASNPLPPRARKAGSVGLAAGTEIVILDEAGNTLPPGKIGEVAVRGHNVTSGYENNPAANQDAFRNGWFKTGDQGYLDEEGYLFLTGRTKEIINRGGEKIAPREVDEVLLDHPAVAQAVTFAIPHASLGEDVAAAVVLRPRASATEKDIRAFAATRLSDFKVPQRIVIKDELPKGPTGKLQRIGLAKRLDISEAAFVAPQTPLEGTLAEMWAKLLQWDRVGAHDRFFDLGGNSLLAVRLLSQLRQVFCLELPPSIFFAAPTVQELAKIIEGKRPVPKWSPLVPLQPAGSSPPFFCVHGVGGTVLELQGLAHHFGPDRPFYGIQAAGAAENSQPYGHIEPMAAYYLKELRTVQPAGPYYLGGFSFGGSVALEMAQQLHACGQNVAFLAILDHTPPPTRFWSFTWTPTLWFDFLINVGRWLMDDIWHAGRGERLGVMCGKVRQFMKRLGKAFRAPEPSSGKTDVEEVFEVSNMPETFRRLLETHCQALRDYVPRQYPGRITLFRARTRPLFRLHGDDLGWRPLAGGGLEVVTIRGNHETLLREPRVADLAASLLTHLAKAQSSLQTQLPIEGVGPHQVLSHRSVPVRPRTAEGDIACH